MEKDIKKIDYKKSDLINYFMAYNNCQDNHEFTVYKRKRKQDLFNLSVRPRYDRSSLTIKNNGSNTAHDFGSVSGFRLAIVAELVMPFHRNKIAIVTEAFIQKFEAKGDIETKNNVQSTQGVRVNYKAWRIPVGLRYYFFLNDNSKVFINGYVVIDAVRNSTIHFEQTGDLTLVNTVSLAAGVGYNYNNRYTIELRSIGKRNMLSNYHFWTSEYGSSSIIFGLRLF